ncbi:MAG: TetR/AcrR family transcriptional regulator [Actinobacteria bacterium]|nr:TetR/AcrR family transcriptional regulator [Actinomycetota bacterium]
MSEPTTTSPDTARQRQRMPQERATTTARIVLEAAIDHIEHGGEQSVRISDISRSTGVSYGSVYHHFGDRNGLIRAAQLERLRRQPGVDIDAFRMRTCQRFHLASCSLKPTMSSLTPTLSPR